MDVSWNISIVFASQGTAHGQIKHRLCSNYKQINQCILKHNFLLPRPEDFMDLMRDSTFFSVFNLQSANRQLPLWPEDRAKTAIITSDAQYQFHTIPFGLSMALQSMQGVMHVLFEDELGKFFGMSVDNLAGHSTNEEEHPEHFWHALMKLAEAGFLIAVKKCRFFQMSILYLRPVINSKGISPHPGNIAAVME